MCAHSHHLIRCLLTTQPSSVSILSSLEAALASLFQASHKRVQSMITQTMGELQTPLRERPVNVMVMEEKAEERVEKQEKVVEVKRGKRRDRLEALMVNKGGVERDKERIQARVKGDENIDLEKINKYFENVVNERHFLDKYQEKEAARDNHREEYPGEDECRDVFTARKFLKAGLTSYSNNNYLGLLREKTRFHNLERVPKNPKAVNTEQKPKEVDILAQWKKQNFQSGQFTVAGQGDTHRSESIELLITEGANRNRTGVIKEHQQLDPFSNMAFPSSFSLPESEFIPLLAPVAHSASILDNPTYKQSPFYPLAKEMRKKEGEERKNRGMVEELYRKIRDNFSQKMADTLT